MATSRSTAWRAKTRNKELTDEGISITAIVQFQFSVNLTITILRVIIVGRFFCPALMIIDVIIFMSIILNFLKDFLHGSWFGSSYMKLNSNHDIRKLWKIGYKRGFKYRKYENCK